MEFPSKWATVIVEYGEKKKHFMQSEESGGQFQFHATEEAAQKWAHDHCAWKQQFGPSLKNTRLRKGANGDP